MAINLPNIDVSKWGNYSDILQNLLKGKLQSQEQAEQGEYHKGLLDVQQQQESRLGALTPLNMELLKAQIDANKELANQRKTAANFGAGKGGVDLQNVMALSRQAMADNPGIDIGQANQIASAWLSGMETLPDGTVTPQPSGVAQQLLTNVQRKNAPVAVQNQAANMNVLANDLNSIDIEPVAKFAGLPGKIKVAEYTAKMARGEDVPQEFRDYKTFVDVTSNFAMDALRKGFGTSVVPAYVYSTLGKASNPSSSWWSDPKQVKNDWNATKKWINENAKKYSTLAKHGVNTPLEEIRPGAGKATIGKHHVTEENILHTMKETGLSREEVMKRLKEKGLI